MGYVRGRSLGIGAALLGAASTSSPKRPNYYAKPGDLSWSNAGMRDAYQQLVGIDTIWHQFLDVWEQIPGIDLLLGTAGISKQDVKNVADLPCPIVSQLALVLEAGFGNRRLDDAFFGALNNGGATLAAIGGYLGVASAIFTVIAAVGAGGGLATLGISAAAAGVAAGYAAVTAVAAAIVAVLAAVCFGIAGGQVDCSQFRAAAQTSAGAFGHDLDDDDAQSACRLLNARYTAQARADLKAKAKVAAKAKTALAVQMARRLGVTFNVLFQAAARNGDVDAWVDACFAAAKKGKRMPTPSTAVIAAVPGASAAGAAKMTGGAATAATATASTGVPLKAPGVGFGWWLLGAFVAAGAGVAVWRRS